jgi:hypothetical protein
MFFVKLERIDLRKTHYLRLSVFSLDNFLLVKWVPSDRIFTCTFVYLLFLLKAEASFRGDYKLVNSVFIWATKWLGIEEIWFRKTKFLTKNLTTVPLKWVPMLTCPFVWEHAKSFSLIVHLSSAFTISWFTWKNFSLMAVTNNYVGCTDIYCYRSIFHWTIKTKGNSKA